jgi:phospholipid/cholesterol/gamma-HCH transport system substrate-binding protein
MKANRELAFVGTFVAVAVGILLFTMLYISGVFRGNGNLYRAHFKNANGLQEGGDVRYAGGPPIGRITKVAPDPQDPLQMQVEFRVQPGIPVKTDSAVKIASLSELGDNYLAILPGSPAAPMAPNGASLQTGTFSTFDDVETTLSAVLPNAQAMMNQLTAEVDKIQKTIGSLNAQLSPQNRKKISRAIAQSNDMVATNRRTLPTTMRRVDASTVKMNRSLDNLKQTLRKLDRTLSHLDKTIVTKDPDILARLKKLHQDLDSAKLMVDRFDRKLSTTDVDGMIENMRQISENLKDLTETIKTRPNSLIRSPDPKPRRPGQTAH